MKNKFIKGQCVAAKDNSNTNGASVTAKDNSDTSKNYKDDTDMVNSNNNKDGASVVEQELDNNNNLSKERNENQTSTQKYKKEPMWDEPISKVDMQVEDVAMFKVYKKHELGNIVLALQLFKDLDIGDVKDLVHDFLADERVMESFRFRAALDVSELKEDIHKLYQEEEDHVRLLEEIKDVVSILKDAIREMYVLKDKKEEYQKHIVSKLGIEKALAEADKFANEKLCENVRRLMALAQKDEILYGQLLWHPIEDYRCYYDGYIFSVFNDLFHKKVAEKKEALEKLEKAKATHPYNQNDVDTAQAEYDQKEQEAQEDWCQDEIAMDIDSSREEWKYGWLKTIGTKSAAEIKEN